MTPLDQHQARRGRRTLPVLASLGVTLLLGGAASTVARRSASAHSGNTAAIDEVIGQPTADSSTAAPGAGTCATPNPLTPRQLRELAHQPVIAPTTPDTTRPARPQLRALAKAVTTSACDRAEGAYAYVQIRQWVISNTATTGTALLQYQHWLAADGSGRSTSSTTREPADENPPTDETFPPGASPVDPAPLNNDPAILAARLDSINPFALGPQSPLHVLAELNQWQTPGRHVQAAAVAVLRDTHGLTYHGVVTDRAGRPGIAIAASSHNGATRDLIILDPHTGELLAYEHTAMRDPGALGNTRPTVLTYTLYITHTHTPTVLQR